MIDDGFNYICDYIYIYQTMNHKLSDRENQSDHTNALQLLPIVVRCDVSDEDVEKRWKRAGVIQSRDD